MIAVIQRVSIAEVKVAKVSIASIEQGLLILLGIEDADNNEDLNWLVKKIVQMRIFSDGEGKMNLSALDVQAEFLVISQFTLHAKTKKGNRPSFIKAAKAVQAETLYEDFIQELSIQSSHRVQYGKFGADMQVSLINDGPVTIIIDTKNKH
ncbi:MAG: D-tyrosyl-tRNA(Tyr) deacylase [Flammeovirgaceae bacterium]|nr:D-tyrosyl-tRNA(Tyr) deacylase [Flammeovirgaceae bacterium]|tara:strand:- start:3245 stop:3697 length:453 start_codon:yes stop_codon:yes gene_type:complete